jgi:hypothetical protein
MSPEQRAKSSPVFLRELAGPPRISQNGLQELGIDEFSELVVDLVLACADGAAGNPHLPPITDENYTWPLNSSPA